MSENAPSIWFRLDPRSGIAPYRQLVDQVRRAVAEGRLRGGDQLPSVRVVVTQVTINPNTVHRAYRELEHLGIAEGRPGLGTFITPRAHRIPGESLQATLDDALSAWVERARALGMSDDEMIEELRRLMNHDETVSS